VPVGAGVLVAVIVAVPVAAVVGVPVAASVFVAVGVPVGVEAAATVIVGVDVPVAVGVSGLVGAGTGVSGQVCRPSPAPAGFGSAPSAVATTSKNTPNKTRGLALTIDQGLIRLMAVAFPHVNRRLEIVPARRGTVNPAPGT
jgi:hypothetical protein